MNTLPTVTEVLTQLKERGYMVDFNLDENCLVCHGNSLKLHPEDFKVDQHYRFEGASDPGDEAIVYAISSLDGNIKGTLINGYGISSNPISAEMIEALNSPVGPGLDINTTEKSNSATPQRPEGDRLIDAELIEIDLSASKDQIRNEEAWKNNDRNAITLFKNENMRILMIALHEGAEMKTHTAPGVISVQVLEGGIIFWTTGKSINLDKDQMITLQKGVPHSVTARKESIFLLTLSINS